MREHFGMNEGKGGIIRVEGDNRMVSKNWQMVIIGGKLRVKVILPSQYDGLSSFFHFTYEVGDCLY